jgi:hypothetical protein
MPCEQFQSARLACTEHSTETPQHNVKQKRRRWTICGGRRAQEELFRLRRKDENERDWAFSLALALLRIQMAKRHSFSLAGDAFVGKDFNDYIIVPLADGTKALQGSRTDLHTRYLHGVCRLWEIGQTRYSSATGLLGHQPPGQLRDITKFLKPVERFRELVYATLFHPGP